MQRLRETRHFEAKCELNTDHIEIVTGDIFEVEMPLDNQRNNRIFVKIGEKKTLITTTQWRCCLCLSDTTWFFPNVSRPEAGKLLLTSDVHGAFLIRKSDVNTSQENHNALAEYYWKDSGKMELQLIEPVISGRSPFVFDKRDLLLGDKIGAGYFGEVMSGKLNGDTPVALKLLKEGRGSRFEFEKEAQLLANLRHSNILTLLGISGDPIELMAMEMRRMSGGSLLNNLREKPDRVTLRDQIHWCFDIISGLNFLTTHGVIHRDIAARNILLNHKHIAKIGDFGMAKVLEEEEEYYRMTSSAKLPVRWIAPEASKRWIFSPASDIWAYGVTIWEICALGERPYKDIQNGEVQKQIRKGRRLKPSNFNCNTNHPDVKPFYKGIYAIMEKCWLEEREKRIKSSEALKKSKSSSTSTSKIYSGLISCAFSWERFLPNKLFHF
ncbi:Oidioi.mRNA.OKI2018_I69.chr2.g7677.t1.cds [Oikopleura dioica]|uniref:non-specific protein-tyrosine kinase n=1 Tax=Oikopleura dioica TaxID=34765 RepID=A0ABN7TDQ3_OIKDI|nr:Oidioi.mRNA.OKI2018_I69.chr2.g7677.t1.cds [Oikopleura dioica]